MARCRLWFVLLVGVLCLWIVPVALAQGGEPSERDLEFEQQILARLAEIDPQAPPLFQAATQAMDAFDFRVNRAVQSSLETGAILQNLYTMPEVEDGELSRQMEQKIEEAINRPTSAYDSHPSIQERIRLAQALPGGGSGAVSTHPVWDLLPGAEVLQEEMTAHVRAQVEQIRRAAEGQRPARA